MYGKVTSVIESLETAKTNKCCCLLIGFGYAGVGIGEAFQGKNFPQKKIRIRMWLSDNFDDQKATSNISREVNENWWIEKLM